jgi:dCMP deaminase
VGAVIVSPDNRQIAQGYNGAAPGMPGCLSHGACPRGKHYKSYAGHTDGKGIIDWCACGKPWPCDESVPPGSSYDTGKGTCDALHAEQNAILDAGTKAASIRGCRMYVTEEPCAGCIRMCRGAQLAWIFWPGNWLELTLES